MTIDTVKLDTELFAAKLAGTLPDYAGVDSNGNISWLTTPTTGELTSSAAIVTAHNGAIPLGQVDATTTGAKLVAIVGINGQAFLGSEYLFYVPKIVGKTVDPQGSLGTNSPNYNNIQVATTLTGWAQHEFQRFTWGISGRKVAVVTPTPIYINILIAAVATSYILEAKFYGDYRNLPS